MSNEDNSLICSCVSGITLILIAIFVVLVGCLVELWRTRRLTAQSLDLYTAEAMCWQEAEAVGGYCQLEEDADGTYAWYMSPPQTGAESRAQGEDTTEAYWMQEV